MINVHNKIVMAEGLPTTKRKVIQCIGISIPHGGKIKRTFNGNRFIPYIRSVGVLDGKIKKFFPQGPSLPGPDPWPRPGLKA